MPENLTSRFNKTAQKFSNKVAIRWKEGSLTYGELKRRIELGTVPEGDCPQFYPIRFFAILSIGSTVVLGEGHLGTATVAVPRDSYRSCPQMSLPKHNRRPNREYREKADGIELGTVPFGDSPQFYPAFKFAICQASFFPADGNFIGEFLGSLIEPARQVFRHFALLLFVSLFLFPSCKVFSPRDTREEAEAVREAV